MSKTASIIGGLALAFWLGALVDHVLAGCGSPRCTLKALMQ